LVANLQTPERIRTLQRKLYLKATIRDRVVQTAAKLVLEPIFEADLDPSAYGYRPGRGGADAIKEAHRLLCRGYTDVVDADLSAYFDTIPHRELVQSVARRIVDRHVLWLIKLWLKAPVEERDDTGKRRLIPVALRFDRSGPTRASRSR
jgi:RNA-directed DNA polymerase